MSGLLVVAGLAGILTGLYSLWTNLKWSPFGNRYLTFACLLLGALAAYAAGYVSRKPSIPTPTTAVQVQSPSTADEDIPQTAEVVEEPTSDDPLIPGALLADAKLNLQNQWGLSFGHSRAVPDSGYFLQDGSTVDPDTGVSLECDVTMKATTALRFVTFRVDGVSVAGILPADQYLDVSRGFLGYCATLPYEGSDPAKAKAWVEQNMSAASQQAVTTSIGQVKFTLAGGPYMRLLSLEAIPQE